MSPVTHSLVDGGPEVMCGSQFIEDLQQCGQGPGLGLTTKWTILAVLIGQLWETLPWRAEEPTKKKGRLFANKSIYLQINQFHNIIIIYQFHSIVAVQH